MGLDFNVNRPVAGVNSNFFINPILQSQYNLRPVTLDMKPDSLSVNSDLTKYATENAIIDMIKANPEVAKILAESKIPIKVNMKTLNNLMQSHLQDTKKITLGIVNNLAPEFKPSVNYQALQKAAILHDVGKCLIPESIINKPEKLTDEEFEIMQKHAVLSYELLKTTDLDKETLELVKNHHQNAQKTGYPQEDGVFVADINQQILQVADMYSALTEERSYKPAMNKNQALLIIHQDMKAGKIHPQVFKALVDFANKDTVKSNESENLAVVDSKGKVADFKPENRLSA